MMYQPSDRPLPVIVLDHPMQMISADEMDKRAKQLVDAIEKLLDDDGREA